MAAVPSVVPAARSLAALRREIDSIDDQLQDLLVQRAEVVAEVAGAKLREGGAAAPVFRAGREAEILRRLLARNRTPLPAELVVRLWREIMVTSSRQQGPLTVAVAAAGADLARDHFGAAGLRRVASAAAVLAAVAKGRAQLGVLPLSGWWHRRPPDIRILAGLPFVRDVPGKAPQAVVIGRQDFEPSSDDALYVAVTWAKGARRPKLPSARVLAATRRGGAALSLIETTASYAELRAAVGYTATVEFLGGYARPIVLSSSNIKPPKAKR
ncbi:MAG: chorismate mutase [Alphaproteobacteria bacterium]|nr:chorismate mutase [Alphaproteobacteria bacterium]